MELPEHVRAGLARWTAEAVAGREGLRAVPEASLHVTLVFLGQTPASDVPAVWGSVPDGVRAPSLTGAGLLALPRRRPHVFALTLGEHDGGAATLQRGIAEALGVAERRPWLPHITLARVRKGHRVTRLADDPPRVDPFDATAVSLLRSHPGSRYEVLERAELEPQSS